VLLAMRILHYGSENKEGVENAGVENKVAIKRPLLMRTNNTK